MKFIVGQTVIAKHIIAIGGPYRGVLVAVRDYETYSMLIDDPTLYTDQPHLISVKHHAWFVKENELIGMHDPNDILKEML